MTQNSLYLCQDLSLLQSKVTPYKLLPGGVPQNTPTPQQTGKIDKQVVKAEDQEFAKQPCVNLFTLIL